MVRRRLFWVPQTALILALAAGSPASAAPPLLVLDQPIGGSIAPSSTPIVAGTTDCTNGACSDITVTIHAGASSMGTVAQVLTVARGASWSTVPAPLSDGIYTIVATQSRQGKSGGPSTTTPTTFTVDAVVEPE